MLLGDLDVDSQGNNVAIRFASEHGHLAIVDRLLQRPETNTSGPIRFV